MPELSVALSIYTLTDVAAAATASVTSTVKLCRTQSYSSTFPGVGGALFRRCSGQPTHDIWFRTADRYLPDGTVSSGNGGYWELHEDSITPEMAGAVNDGSTPDDAAFDRCYAWVMEQTNGGTIRLLPGDGYRLDDEHYIHPVKNLRLHWESGSKVLCGLTGASSILFKATKSGGGRGAALTISGASRISFHADVTAGMVGAVFFEYLQASDLRLEGRDHTWLHYRGNSTVRLSGMWNCDLGPITFWGAGIRKPRKSTSAVFTIALGATALSSNIDVFEAGDIGRTLTVDPGDDSAGECFTISAVSDARNATVAATAKNAFTAKGGNFEAAKGAWTNSGTTLTMEASVLSASDVGRVVYLENGEVPDGSGSPKCLFRTTIASYTSGTVCELVDIPTATNANGIVHFSPGVEIFGGPDITNDFCWDGMHLEQIVGTGFIIDNAIAVQMPNTKLHCLNGSYGAYASDMNGVLSRTTGYINGIFEGTPTNGRAFLSVCGTNGLLSIGSTISTAVQNIPLVYASNMVTGGRVVVGDWTINNKFSNNIFDAPFLTSGTAVINHIGRLSAYSAGISTPLELGNSRPLRALYLSDTSVAVSKNDGAMFQAISSGADNPGFAGLGVGGTVEAPTTSSDFQNVAVFHGYGLNSSGSVTLGAQIKARARVSSGNVGGDIVVSTKTTGGSITDCWGWSPAGIYYPATDITFDLGSITNRVNNTYSKNLRPGAGATIWTSGTGTPEGSVTAPVGSFYTRTDGGAGTTLYVKESGSGNTGWVAK
jgi:hypothetical protein